MTSSVVLRARIETLYMAETDRPRPEGCMTWFGKRIGVTRRAVWAWCSGDRNPKQPILMLLTYLERDAGPKKLEAAKQRRQEYYAAQLQEEVESDGVG